ncbi:transposase [Plantactinospora sp. ZYX-F-223]|uniref:transposase n=1 Tax=Plantactinospora sp. ZYX-F-223 TaxID=3144103 RepID=UPI0031FBD037
MRTGSRRATSKICTHCCSLGIHGSLVSRGTRPGCWLPTRRPGGVAGRKLPLIRRCHDGSWLSVIGGRPVQIIEARISITTTGGHHTSDYRLITTLLDPHRYPAADLAELYHQRWEIETTYLELKSTILGGRVLRARTPDGIDQEIHALLIVYQVSRTAMVDATDSRPGVDPDRASFTTALNAARDQVVQAAGVIADTVIDLVGVIGEHVLANLLPDRRIRTKPA